MFLTELMEHVHLPLLASRPDVLNNVIEEPLLKNSPKCKNYMYEALRFNLLKSVQHFTILQIIIWCKPRQFGDSKKVILIRGLIHCPSVIQNGMTQQPNHGRKHQG